MTDGRPDDAVASLRRRLEERPADEFPLDHATTRYHLGLTLAAAGDLDGAEDALVEAARLFEDRLPSEWAKVLNALGAVLREGGRPEAAQSAFEHAARVFEQEGLTLDHGAALFNLGLVTLDQRRVESALHWFRQASECLPADAASAQRSAALREQGAALLMLGRTTEALPLLEEARRLGEIARDPDAVAAAANVSGLSLLDLGRLDDARRSFATAVANAPPSTRPEMHAMARANLALACESAGDHDRARMLVRQVLAMPGTAPAVVEQAREILRRVGDATGGLAQLLHATPRDERPSLARAEMTRWLHLSDDRLRAEVRAWIDEQPAVRASRAEVAEPWLASLLELPPTDLEAVAGVVNGVLRTCRPEAAEAFRTGLSAAMARFHEPQWRRLEAAFEIGDGSP